MATDRRGPFEDVDQETADLGSSDAGPDPTGVSGGERLALLEAQMAVLLTMGRIHNEALTELAEALERLPTEEPDEAAEKVNRAARHAHELLLALREVPH
jgi:hypothetical protein